ncbi:hypothetical protein VTH06DRAFT_5263 [Thermothelomyces fergusii]
MTKIEIFPTLGEIMSDAPEYLPSTDWTQPHFLHDPVQRHIDSAFRLLRHDIFGSLKQVIGRLLEERNAADAVSLHRIITANIKAHIYSGASIHHVLINKRDGFEAIVSFTKPPQVRNSTPLDQQRWWQASSRLEPGGLVCFVSTHENEKSFLAFVVTEKNTTEVKEGQNKSTLVADRFKPSIKVKLASESVDNLAMVNRMCVEKEEGLLVEIPGLIPDTFVPILENLQRMMKDGDLVFRRWILPSTGNEDDQRPTRVPPPAYARKPGFKFRLRTITRDGQPALSINPAQYTGGIATRQALEASTGLDPGQSAGLIAALTREYALIQGPPGTGKSYVGVQLVRVLLDHQAEANLGPILVICYTNHALDQFLKHLLDVGIHKIIRIGGQSRAEELEGKNLRVATLVWQAKRNIHSLTLEERWALVESWIDELIEHESERTFDMLREAKDHREEIQKVHDGVNLRTLLQADVVGVTTTGLARNIKMLCRLGVKVVICEEAAEVMEPHLLSALMPGLEHFIQIGDHRQLRPQIQNYLQFSMETAVGRAHQLDRSQFERRAVEDDKDDGVRVKSHSNPWEVSMAKALIHHLIRQGEYKSTDIALLTPYTGQLQKLRASLGSDFEVFLSDRDLEALAKEGFEPMPEKEQGTETGPRKMTEKKTLVQTVRLATVDNFQGEEAKVVVVSLVRSNSNAKVGFLRTENRINVLLSRAQHGMYLIGNAKTYENVPMWADVLRQLRARNAVGRSIALRCRRHPNTPLFCSEPKDFAIKSPEGGCTLTCDMRLEPCGHRCPAPCHSKLLHDAFNCLEPCPRLRSTCRHPCPKLCSQLCGPCNVQVDGVILPCGHVKDKNLELDTFNCPTDCTEMLECGHQLVLIEGIVAPARRNVMFGALTRGAIKNAGSPAAHVIHGLEVSYRYKDALRLARKSMNLRKSMEAEHQPTKKLFDAVMRFQRLQREGSLERKLRDLTLSEVQIADPEPAVYDRQIALAAHRLQLRLLEAMLRDTFLLLAKPGHGNIHTDIAGQPLDKRSASFLKQCRALIACATNAKLPRLVIEASLSYARVAELEGWYCRTFPSKAVAPTDSNNAGNNNNDDDDDDDDTAARSAPGTTSKTEEQQQANETPRDVATGLLERALELCATIPSPDGEAYRAEVEETMRLFSGPRYEEVTPAEIAAIKAAMVTGAGGLATHSGHWYHCRNGHPFAIGECGMPMEMARCPECGEVIGGTDHRPVEGMERDMRMELA